MARIRIKATDDGYNANFKSNEGILIRAALDSVGLKDYNIVSYNPERGGHGRLANVLLKKQHFFNDELIEKFSERNEPFFKWMLNLSQRVSGEKRMWAELRQKEQAVGKSKSLYLLGLPSIEYHHISKTKLDKDVEVVKLIPDYEIIWFYDGSLDDLINDILIKLKEKGME